MIDYVGVAVAALIAFGGAWLYVRWRARDLGYAAGEYADRPPEPRTGDVLTDLHLRGQQVGRERADSHDLSSRKFTFRMLLGGAAAGLGLSAVTLPSTSCSVIPAFTTAPFAVLIWFIIPESAWGALHTDEKPEPVIGRIAFRGGFLTGLAPVAVIGGAVCWIGGAPP